MLSQLAILAAFHPPPRGFEGTFHNHENHSNSSWNQPLQFANLLHLICSTLTSSERHVLLYFQVLGAAEVHVDS